MLILDSNPNCDQIRDSDDLIVLNWFFFFFNDLFFWSHSIVVYFTGYKIPVIENLGATLDQFDTIDFSDNEVRKLDGFPLLKRLKTLLMNSNRIWWVWPYNISLLVSVSQDWCHLNNAAHSAELILNCYM